MNEFRTERLKTYKDRPVVYFISDGQGYTKVGVASDIVTRLSNMQVGNVSELKVIELIETDDIAEAYELESQIHQKLKRSRIRGEWFDSEAVVNYLQGEVEDNSDGKTYMADECDQFNIKDAIHLWTILLEEGGKSQTEDEFVARVSKRYDAEMPDYWKEFDKKRYAKGAIIPQTHKNGCEGR